jgi:uncharacterized repeat protein (TIGR01451 family)
VTRHPRFTGGLLATLALVAAGVASGRPTLFVAAAIPLCFVAYGALSAPPSVENLRVERSLSEASPLPGDRVSVTLTVRNETDAVLSDVRIADGVPEDLRVVSGTPEGAFALPPEDEATLSYTVVADRGQFSFEPATVRVRGVSASASTTSRVPADGPDALDCRVNVADLPLRRQTTAYAGALPTDTGGPGIEFHSTRDYQHGDPVSRINWRQYAKTGELSTVNYRERRAAAVVLAVDARAESDVAARAGTPSGASLSAYAAAQSVRPLEEAGHQVGLAVFGINDPVTGAADPAWVPPSTGDAHHARLATVLDAALETSNGDDAADSGSAKPGAANRSEASDEQSDDAKSDDTSERAPAAAPDGGDARVGRMAERLEPGVQVVVCSPALDEFAADLARRLRADEHRVTAVCPDVTATNTPGNTLAAADRALAVDALRSTGARVVDWSTDESLASAVARATAAIEEGER